MSDDSDSMPELEYPEEPGKAEKSKLEKSPQEKRKTGDVEEEYREISEDGWEDILGSGRLRKRVIKEGTKGYGDGQGRPNRGDNVKINFKGYFQDQMFIDEENYEFVTAEGEVAQMLDLVVVLMNVEEECEVIADPEFAYGDVGFGDVVPPKAAVRMEIKLLSYSPPVQVTEMPLKSRQEMGRRKKSRGNFWFSRQNYPQAVQCYRKAGELFDDEHIDLEIPVDKYSLSPELQSLLEDRLNTFNNLAMAQMKIEAWDSALAAVKQVLRIEPNNEKALYRKSRILTEKCRVEEAVGVLKRITRLYPKNTKALADLAKLTAKQKKSRLNEERMSKKMLGLDKYEEEKKKESLFWKFTKNKLMFTGVVVGVSGVLLGGFAAWFGNH